MVIDEGSINAEPRINSLKQMNVYISFFFLSLFTRIDLRPSHEIIKGRQMDHLLAENLELSREVLSGATHHE